MGIFDRINKFLKAFWDSDGADTIGFFVPPQNKWYLKNNLIDGWATGVTGFKFCSIDPMVPVVGDWNGDGVDTVGAYVPAKWRWYLKGDHVNGWSKVISFKFSITEDNDLISGDWE